MQTLQINAGCRRCSRSAGGSRGFFLGTRLGCIRRSGLTSWGFSRGGRRIKLISCRRCLRLLLRSFLGYTLAGRIGISCRNLRTQTSRWWFDCRHRTPLKVTLLKSILPLQVKPANWSVSLYSQREKSQFSEYYSRLWGRDRNQQMPQFHRRTHLSI